MSAISAGVPSPGGGLPVVNQATEPAAVRHGGRAAQNAYDTGLAFEQMLVSQLTQQLSDTVSGAGAGSNGLGGADPTSSGGLGGGDPTGAGGATGDSALGAYSSLLPSALSSSVMADGGTGVAMQIAQSIDPALGAPPVHAGPATTGGGAT